MTGKDRQDKDTGIYESVPHWALGGRLIRAGLVRPRPGIGAVVAMVAASKATVGDMLAAAEREDDGARLLRRLSQSRAWRWQKGVVLSNGRIVSDVRPSGDGVWMTLASDQMSTTTMFVPAHGSSMWQSNQDGAPIVDIEHPSTKGAMIQMLRDIAGDALRGASFSRASGRWWVYHADLGCVTGKDYATEGEALARAIIELGSMEVRR